MQHLQRLTTHVMAFPSWKQRLTSLPHSRPLAVKQLRAFQTSHSSFNAGPTKLHNILEGGPTPPVQVRRASGEGLELRDGLIIPSACIFLGGTVFLWRVPASLWDDWREEDFQIFEVIVPKPEILFLGTGRSVSHPPPSIRSYLNSIGIQLDVMDTWNACTTYNLLSEEGRHVAAALLPLSPRSW